MSGRGKDGGRRERDGLAEGKGKGRFDVLDNGNGTMETERRSRLAKAHN